MNNPEAMREFGIRLRNARLSAGMTLEELGNNIGYTKSGICKCERGQRDMPIPKMKEIAKILGVTPAYLMGLEDSVAPTTLSETECRLLKYAAMIGDLSDRDRELVINLIESLGKKNG